MWRETKILLLKRIVITQHLFSHLANYFSVISLGFRISVEENNSAFRFWNVLSAHLLEITKDVVGDVFHILIKDMLHMKYVKNERVKRSQKVEWIPTTLIYYFQVGAVTVVICCHSGPVWCKRSSQQTFAILLKLHSDECHWTLFVFLIFLLLFCWGYIVSLWQKSYNISWFNSPPPSFSFISPPPSPGIVSSGLIFPFTYMCTKYFQHIHPPTSYHYIVPFPLVPNPIDRICFTFMFSIFVKNNDGVFLCELYIYIII
jgi:hypothetical protein